MAKPYEKMYLISEEDYLDRRNIEPVQTSPITPASVSNEPSSLLETSDDSTLAAIDSAIENERKNLSDIKLINFGRAQIARLATARAAAVRLAALERAAKSVRSREVLQKLINAYRQKHAVQPQVELFTMTPQNLQLPWQEEVIEILNDSLDDLLQAVIPVNAQVGHVEAIVMAEDPQHLIEAVNDYMSRAIIEISSEHEGLQDGLEQIQANPGLLDATA